MIKRFLNRFAKPETIYVPAAKPPSVANRIKGFFSKDVQTLQSRRDAKNLEYAIARTFQRTDKDFVKSGGLAMDSLPSSGGISPYQLQATISSNQLAWYASQGFIGYQTCAILSQHWLVDKACTMPARDAIRNGYDVTSNNGESIDPAILQYIRLRDIHFNISENMVQMVRQARIFGIRIAMFDIVSTDPQYYEKPYNPDGIAPDSYRGVVQIDPYWIVPELDFQSATNPMNRNFYEPTFWRVAGGQRIHRSHLIIVRTSEVPDILKPTYLYGGLPLTQRIYERVYAAERCANEAPQLLLTKRTNALKMDTTAALANEGEFEANMTTWAYYRDNYGVKVLGDGEEIQQFDTALADLDAVIMTQYQLVASIAGVPATKLLGTTPKGFQSTGEAEAESYRQELESIQNSDLTPFLQRHHEILCLSEVKHRFDVRLETEIVWTPLDSPTAAEVAATNLARAQAAVALASVGAIDGNDERSRIMADPESGYNGLVDQAEPSILDDSDVEGQEIATTPDPQAAIDPAAQ